uniref:Uncharacterized protein n=1 Tax=Setaria viridis TaxID=4556 RepID=A0A4V6D4N9_SETVI|nr:hypothetical protein SEVIR_7G268000v2 [Setaria viridis]
MRRHLVWNTCSTGRVVGAEVWTALRHWRPVTRSWMEAEGKTGHVASSFCFFPLIFSLWSIALVD